MRKKRMYLTFMAILFSSLLSTVIAQEIVTIENSRAWPSEMFNKISDDIGDEIDHASIKLTYSLFDSVVEQSLFSHQFDNGVNLKLEVDRDIYFNNDIYNSYSVVDSFKVPISIPLNYGVSIPTELVSLGISFSASLSLNLLNIRQVRPADINNIPTIENVKNDLAEDVNTVQNDKKLGEYKTGDKNFDLNVIRRYILVDHDNPLQNAMFGKLWNILTNPLRLPITKNNFKKMEQREIFSYGINGTVQMGSTLGWSSVLPTGEVPSVGVGISTYLSGQFRVSILKEQRNGALLKLSKITERGVTAFAGTESSSLTIMKGFSLVSYVDIDDVKIDIVPFSLSVNSKLNKTIDVAFRYDFTKPDAWDAYLQGTKGLLKRSDELSLIKDSGVTRAFDRQRTYKERSNSYRISFLMMFDKGRNSRARFSHAKIKLPEGEYKIFKAVSESSRFYDFFIAGKEHQSYNFTLTIDEDKYRQNSDGMNLRIIMKKFDSESYGKELRRYIKEVEFVTGDIGRFPQVPLYEPLPGKVILCSQLDTIEAAFAEQEDECFSPRSLQYGQSEFYYRINYSSQKILKFIDQSEQSMWSNLERGFGMKPGIWFSHVKRWKDQLMRAPLTLLNLPLMLANLHIKKGSKLYAATKFFVNWKKLKNVKEPHDFVKNFSRLFKVNYYEQEYLYTFISSVGRSKKFEYRGKASSLFGTISRGRLQENNLDEIIAKDELEFNFDHIGGRDYNIDHKSIINSFNVKVIDKDHISINIELPETGKLPAYIFFRVDYTSFFKYENLATGVILNKGVLHAGMNKIIISRDEKKGLLGELARFMFTGKRVLTSMAVGHDGENWGMLHQSKLKTVSSKSK